MIRIKYQRLWRLVALSLVFAMTMAAFSGCSFKKNRNSLFKDQEFAVAIAEAITGSNRGEDPDNYETVYAKDITQEMLDEITGLIVTVNAVDTNGTYAPIIMLSKEEYTEYYIEKKLLKENLEIDTGAPYDYYYTIYDLKNLSDIKLFRNLKLIDISGLNIRALYDLVLDQYNVYEEALGGYEGIMNPYEYTVKSFTDPSIIDREDLTNLSFIYDPSKLEALALGYSSLSTLNGLDKADNLKYLELASCELSTLEGVGMLKSVKKLNLADNKSLKSLKGFASAFNKETLTYVDLSIDGEENTVIVDWSALLSFTRTTVNGLPKSPKAEK